MTEPEGNTAPRRAPFTDIQNTHENVLKDTTAAKPSAKDVQSNKLRAIQLGQKTLAAFKERRAQAKARATVAKGAKANPVSLSQSPSTEAGPTSAVLAPYANSGAASQTSAGAGQQSARALVHRHMQTPSKIPAAMHAPARDAPRLIVPTPTKIPSPPKAACAKASAPESLQAQSVPVSPTRHAPVSARPFSALPTPRVCPQAVCMERRMTGGQCNPLFDHAALKKADHATAPQDQGMHPQLGCSSAGASAEGQLLAPHEAGASMSSSSCSGTILAGHSIANLDAYITAANTIEGMRPPNLDVSHMGASAPQSVHSMGSGLSRSGSFAPSTLSVLYENQAMKMEREELKSELKLISARLAVLEARSKGWGRIGQAPAGRSKSAPRGAPRSRIAAASRPPPITEQEDEAERTDRLQHRMDRPGLPGIAQHTQKAVRMTVSRPSSPRKANSASFGSRANSPARQRRTIVFGSRAPSPTRAQAQTTRNATQNSTGSRAGSPVAKGSAQRQSRNQAAASSRQSAASAQPDSALNEPPAPSMPYRNATQTSTGSRASSLVAKGSAQHQNRNQAAAFSRQPATSAQTDSAINELPAPSMPYRNAFMGGHMMGARRAPPSSIPSAHTGAAAAIAEEDAKPDLATSGPPAPPAGMPATACPSSVERWAGPGGRLGRGKMKQTPKKESKQKVTEDKENTFADKVQSMGQVSKLALTAAKLGLEHAFRPRLA